MLPKYNKNLAAKLRNLDGENVIGFYLSTKDYKELPDISAPDIEFMGMQPAKYSYHGKPIYEGGTNEPIVKPVR